MKFCANCGNDYSNLTEFTLCDGNSVCGKCCQDIIDKNGNFQSEVSNLWKNLYVINTDEFKNMYANPELLAKLDTNEQLLVSPFRKESAKQELYFLRKKLWITNNNKKIETTVLVYNEGLDITEVTSTITTKVKNYYLPIESIQECKSHIKMSKYPLLLIMLILVFYRIDIWAILLSVLFLWLSYGREIVLKTTNGDTYKILADTKTTEMAQLLKIITELKSNSIGKSIEKMQENKKDTFCTVCGNSVSVDENFCKQCGTALKKEEKKIQKESKVIKKKSQKIWIILCVIAVLIVAGINIAKNNELKKQETRDSELKEQEIIDKLQNFTTIDESDENYYFLDNGDKWALMYTSKNEFVRFESDTIIKCFTEIFGEGCFSEGSASDLGFLYDIRDNEAKVYFDVDIEEGHLTSISYNLAEEEYNLIIDGDDWMITDEFSDYLEKCELAESIQQDVKDFKNLLQEQELTIDDLLKVKYDTLKTQFIADMEESKNESEQYVNEENNEFVTDNSLGWKEAYLDYLNENGNTEYGYSLSYIDEDDIPELVIDTKITATGVELCTYDGNSLIVTPVGESVMYRLQENLFCVSGGRMDHYHNIVYKIVDGIPVEVSRGEYGIFDYENMPDNASDPIIYEYYWNGESVSEEDYNTFTEVFSFQDSGAWPTGMGYLYDIIDVLAHPLDITIIDPYVNNNGYKSLLNNYVILFDGISEDKIHFNVMYDDELIGSVSATISSARTAEYRNANSELIIEFDTDCKNLKIEGYIDTIDLTDDYYGLWG